MVEQDREDGQKMDGTMFVIRGTVGYVVLIVLGVWTNTFSDEFAFQLVKYLIPMFLFILGSAVFDVVDGLIALYRKR